MVWLRALIACMSLTALMSLPAKADRVSVLLGSHHFNGSGFEEINPGIFYTWERPPLGYSLGIFRNSYGRAAVAATASYPLARWNNGEFSVFGGIAYYRKEGRNIDTQISGDVIGLGGLQLRQGHVFIQLIPLNDRDSDALISFGLTWPVGR